MADLERQLLSKVMREQDIITVIDAGITVDFFELLPHRKAFTFMKTCWQQHRFVPTIRRLREEYPEWGRYLKVEEPLSDCIEQLKRARRRRIYQSAGKRAAAAFEENDLDTFADTLSSGLRQAGQEVGEVKEKQVADTLDSHVEMLFNRDPAHRILGLSTGFKTIDDATLGLQKQQLVTLIGVPKVGKSSAQLVMAAHIQFQGQHSYFVSFEMTAEEQYDRYIAMGAHVDHHRLVTNDLTAKERKHIREFAEEAKSIGQFTMCTDITRAVTVTGLEAKIERAEPNVVFIDGAYLMRDEETGLAGSDWKAMTNITRDMKRLAQRLEIPIVLSTQALLSKTTRSRNNGHRRLSMESPGYSSSWSQDSDVLLGIEKKEDNENERIIRIIISRNCHPKAVTVQWDWKGGLFGTEVEGSEYDRETDDDQGND